MKRTNKKVFRRYVIIKRCKQDFGLGPGVIARDEIVYTDETKRGFKSPLFLLSQQEDAIEMILKHVTVLYDQNIRRWSKDPQSEVKRKPKNKPKKYNRDEFRG